MAYEKRVAVLKQVNKGFSADGSTLSGAVYAERLGSVLSLKVQAAGLASLKEGRYAVVFAAEGKTLCVELGEGELIKVENAPSIKNGFCVLVAYVREGVQPVAFGRCGSATGEIRDLLSAINAGKKETPKIPVSPNAPPNLPSNTPPTIPFPDPPSKEEPSDRAPFRDAESAYNDEAIAESDYFHDRVQTGDRDEDFAGKSEGKGGKKKSGKNSSKDDGVEHPFLVQKGKLTYYKKIRKEIERAFEKYPSDTRLLAVFPRSEWVKTENALLGVIYEDGQPRYLCVAAEKEGDPPEDMKENCTFVPESPFTQEKGFYIVFQDADTGAYVHVSDA